MQTVKASTILDDAYRLIGWDPDQVDTRDKGDAMACLSRALQEVWDKWWWADVMVASRIALAYDWNVDTEYDAGTTLYYPPTDKYYQPLTAGSSACAETDGETRADWTLWTESRQTEAAWDAGATYAVRDRVRYDGLLYECKLANTGVTPEPEGDANWWFVGDWVPQLPVLNSVGAEVGPWGAVRGVYRHNPVLARNPLPYDTGSVGGVLQVTGFGGVGRAWIWYRRPTPIIAADVTDYAGATTYDAVSDEDRVF